MNITSEVGTFGTAVLGLIWAALEFGEDLIVDLIGYAAAYALSGRSANRGVSAAIYFGFGAAVGFASAILLPIRLVATYPFPGASMVLAPLGVGLASQWYGSWRRRQARDSNWLATFWGGALFAFQIALVRWLMVGRG